MKHSIGVFFICGLLQSFYFQTFSQETYKRNIKWYDIYKTSFFENKNIPFLYFEGAIYDYVNNVDLPVYFERFKLNNTNLKFNIKLKDEIYEEFKEKDIHQIKNLNNVSEQIIINSTTTFDRKAPYISIYLVPIRKNPTSGKYERLVSFEIEVTEKDNSSTNIMQKFTKQTYASKSVLSSGNWYKLGITQTGIYKITYNDLSDMGFNVSSINPRNIKIYGNGGGMLPENNSEFRYDDLAEIAIWVEGENDGSFDANDYILFYGESPHAWKYNTTDSKFHHLVNKYSDKTCYFITTNSGVGKRIETESSTTLPATNHITTFNDYVFHEKELENLIKTGREWYGEKFDILTTYNFSFSFPNIDTDSEIYLSVNVAARSSSNSSFNINANGNTFTSTVAAIPGSYTANYAMTSNDNFNFSTSSSTINVTITYNKPTADAIGWLNYIELNAIRHLIFTGSQLSFRNSESVGINNVSEYTLSNTSSTVSSKIKIWEITNPAETKMIAANLNGNDLIFRLPTDSLREFIAFNNSSFYTPTFIGKIANQDLHGLGQQDMIIISHPNFIKEANRLADIHRNNDTLSVIVVTPQQIYDEFSSGVQDVTAIRNFVKMFYDRASTPDDIPKYLLLFGDGSYDYKDRMDNNTNFVPTYQSLNSLAPTASYVTDDYFGLLDDNEGNAANGDLDVGIGRFPVKTVEEAKNVVDKIIRYTSKTNLINQNSNCASSYSNAISNYGDWKNTICFIGDDEDSNLHLIQADQLATFIDTLQKDYNIDKIYLDAYPQVSTPGGQRYPDVNEAINKRVGKGALIINYTGHGGELGWAHERVLEIADINNWDNTNNMPVFVTATCEFSRFDDPERTAAGEHIFLNENGGGICLFTTTRLAFADANFTLNKSFYDYAFDKTANKYMRMGDFIRLAKVANGSSNNIKNFVLLGDPALTLAYPEYDVSTDSVNYNAVGTSSDTIKALSKVTISGHIQDDNGNKISNFNGIIYPTVFDKASTITTLGNDPASSPKKFNIQNNILYRGKSNVVNGNFRFTFIVPKDIAYKYGFGKISYYATNNQTDANGYYENIIIGGSADSISDDNYGPSIKLYLNDEKFVFGGITNENPLLLAFVNDSNGINTVGNGIGHDIIAVLDDNTEKSIILNDYYEADLNSYKSGTVRYPFSDLSEGLHTLSLKVWDVYNNSAKVYTEFVVAKSAELALSHVLNYPNPFTTSTKFLFEHNHPCCDLDVQIQIFTITGKLVKTISTNVMTDGFRAEPIEWNGTDDYGDRIGRGIYIYKLSIKTTDGSYSEKTDKLVILQ